MKLVSGWHRVFHPLCGADPVTLARIASRAGAPSSSGAARLGVAAACAVARAPFTLAEAALSRLASPPPAPAPLFVIGHPRSGTTHLQNLIAATGAFSVVPPVHAGMPWEPRGLARLMSPLIAPHLPETRLIDRVAVTPESPTEDEVALANLCDLSYFHAIYFPRRFRETYLRGLLLAGASEAQIARRRRRLRAWVDAMTAVRGGRALLLKNPAYTADVRGLLRMWPEARFVHIHRDPHDAFASSRRMLRKATAELGLQRADPAELDAAILEGWPRVIDAALDAGEAAPGAVLHLSYEALDRDPEIEIGRVWGWLGRTDEGEAVARVAAYLRALGTYRKTPHELSTAERAVVTQRWGAAAERLARVAPRRAA